MILSFNDSVKKTLAPMLHNSVGVGDSFGLLSQGSPAMRDNPGLEYTIPLGLDTVVEWLQDLNSYRLSLLM